MLNSPQRLPFYWKYFNKSSILLNTANGTILIHKSL